MPDKIASPPKRKRRWFLRIALALLVLLVLAGVLGPVLAAPFVRSMIVGGMNDTLDARASLDELSFNLAGSLHAGGFALADADGAPLASVGSLDADLSVLALLGRRVEVDVALVGFELDVRRGPDGAWNFERVVKEPAEPAPDEPADEPGEAGELPGVRAHVELRDGRVRVHTAEGVTALEGVTFTLELEDLEERAPFALAARVVGPGGAGGAIDVHGELALARDGRIGADTVEAVVAATIDALKLTELAPLAALAPEGAELPRLAGGVLDVTSNVRLGRGQTLEADLELALDGLALDGPEGPFALDALRFGVNANLDAAGTGTHELTFELPGRSSLAISGRTTALRGDAGRVVGELTATGDLHGLMELARGFAPLVPGRELAGALGADARWDLPASASTGAGTFALAARVDDLALRDERGRALDLGGMQDASFELSAALDGDGGRFDLERFELLAGPVRASAHAGFTGLTQDGAELEVNDSRFELTADLDALNGLARELVELGDAAFGGAITLNANVRDEEGRLATTFQLDVAGLRMSGMEGMGETPAGPMDLSFGFDAALDPAPGGRSTIERLSFESDFLVVAGGGELVDAATPESARGKLEARTRFDPAAASRALAPWLEGHELAGEALVQTQTITIEGERVAVESKLDLGALAVHGPSLGPEGLELSGLTLVLDASSTRTGSEWELTRTTLGFERLAAALPMEEEGAAPMSFELGALQVSLDGRGEGDRSTLTFGATLAQVLVRGVGEAGAGVTLRDLGVRVPSIAFDPAAGTASVPELELASEVLRGTGALELSGLTAVDPRPTLGGQLAFQGEFAPLTGLARAFSGDESTPDLAGGWALDVDLRAAEEQAELKKLELSVPGLVMTVRGTLSGFSGEAPDPAAAFTIEPRVELAELGRWAAPLLDGAGFGGSPLQGQVDVQLAAGALTASGELDAARFEASLPPEAEGGAARELVQEELKITFDLTHDSARDEGRVDLRGLHLASKTAGIDASGAITGAATPDAAQVELDLALRGALERVLADFAAFVPVEGAEGSGALDLRARVVGGAAAARVTGELRAPALDLVLPMEGKDVPVHIHEPARGAEPGFACTFALDAEDSGERVAFERVWLDTETLRGELTGRWIGVPADKPDARARFEALKGSYTYVPERLAQWLGPWLPGELRGAERLPLTFQFDGELDEVDTLSMMRALRGDMQLKLGEVALPGLETGGDLALVATGDTLSVSGDLTANGGRLEFGAALDLRAESPAGSKPVSSSVSMRATKIGARPELAPLLAHVHPLFGALEAAGAGSLKSEISSEFQLSYAAPLTKEALAIGFDALTKKLLAGGGRLELGQVSLKGSPLLSSMVSLLDPKGGGAVSVKPVNFVIRDGQLGYDKPWQWTIAGSPTQFSGTIGLDSSLAMAWQVPVTASLVERYGFMKYFEGETIDVPLQGTVQSPSLSLKSTLDGLAKVALERELKERAAELVPDLGDILGGGRGAGGASPDQLLQRADDLYSKGNKAEAKKLYAEIKSRHTASLTYLLNKSRIDSRSR